MKTHWGNEYVDQRVELTGEIWRECHFDGCVVVLDKVPSKYTLISGCYFRDCKLEGDGWPEGTRLGIR